MLSSDLRTTTGQTVTSSTMDTEHKVAPPKTSWFFSNTEGQIRNLQDTIANEKQRLEELQKEPTQNEKNILKAQVKLSEYEKKLKAIEEKRSREDQAKTKKQSDILAQRTQTKTDFGVQVNVLIAAENLKELSKLPADDTIGVILNDAKGITEPIEHANKMYQGLQVLAASVRRLQDRDIVGHTKFALGKAAELGGLVGDSTLRLGLGTAAAGAGIAVGALKGLAAGGETLVRGNKSDATIQSTGISQPLVTASNAFGAVDKGINFLSNKGAQMVGVKRDPTMTLNQRWKKFMGYKGGKGTRRRSVTRRRM